MQETQEAQVQSLDWEDALEKTTATPPVFLPGKLHGQRSLRGYSAGGRKESDTTKQVTVTKLLKLAKSQFSHLSKRAKRLKKISAPASLGCYDDQLK